MSDKKKYLNQYRLQQKKIERLNEMILYNPRNKSRYLMQIARCERIREEIEAKINNLDDELLREVLFLKYICGKTLKEVAIIIDYSQRHTERMHITALEKIDV